MQIGARKILDTLDIDQFCNLITITFCFLILICLFDIFIINFSIELIDYLGLDLKKPFFALASFATLA